MWSDLRENDSRCSEESFQALLKFFVFSVEIEDEEMGTISGSESERSFII
jgi:hypothetical protein